MTGADTKFWEDVNFGDVVGPAIKGPLSVRHELVWLMGTGSPFLKAHKNEFDYKARHPRFLEYVEQAGEADAPELVYYLDQFARVIGVERAYDYGNQWSDLSMPPKTTTVILPSRERGSVVYPEPSLQFVEEMKKARPLDELKAGGLI